MASLEFQDVARHLIGVIDLKDGRAVHAIAGQRDSYAAVVLGDGTPSDDPLQLAAFYYRLGLRQLYVADLNGIVDGEVQNDLLSRLLDDGPVWDRVLLDAGCGETDEAIRFATRSGRRYRSLSLIVATEAAPSIDTIARMADAIGPNRTVIGMDYRAGDFVSRAGASESSFVSAAISAGVKQFVVLDVAAVGTSSTDAAVAASERVKSLSPEMTIYSGGGISSTSDVHKLLQAGCEYCLAATWLQQMA